MCMCLFPCRFVPSLRQLRQQAFVLYFPPILSSRLTQRLQEVSEGWSGGHMTRGLRG